MYQTLHTIAHKLLPAWLYDGLIGSWDKDGFKKYFKSTGWMFIARAATMVTSFLTITIVARYLGPENLGKLSYAQSFVSILSVFASLGIDQILYRDLVAEPEREKELLGTAIGTKFIFGVFAFLASIGLSVLVNSEPLLTLLIAITAFTFLVNPLGTISILFQSKVQAKYSSQIAIFLAFLIPALKLLVVFFDKGIIYFSLILIVESLFGALWSLCIYKFKYKSSIFNWEFSFFILKRLLKDSWPLLLASLSAYIYVRIDQVMIYHYLDPTSVGLYDVAVRLTEIWGFFPGIIITSLFPALVSSHKNNPAEYKKRFVILSTFTLSVTTAISLFIFIISPQLISVLYGSEFMPSVSVLRIYVWSFIGAIAVSLIQSYLITRNNSFKILLLSILGAILNISLNIKLIPPLGIYGAAYATLGTYLVIIVIFLIMENKAYLKFR